jgi:hypothetical protein
MDGVEGGGGGAAGTASHNSPFHSAVLGSGSAILPALAAAARTYERRRERHCDMFAAWGVGGGGGGNGGGSGGHAQRRSAIVGELTWAVGVCALSCLRRADVLLCVRCCPCTA